jgi:hypothetical protein
MGRALNAQGEGRGHWEERIWDPSEGGGNSYVLVNVYKIVS